MTDIDRFTDRPGRLIIPVGRGDVAREPTPRPSDDDDPFDGVRPTECVVWLAPHGTLMPGPTGPIPPGWHRCAATDGAALITAIQGGTRPPTCIFLRFIAQRPRFCTPFAGLAAVAEATDHAAGRLMRAIMPRVRYDQAIAGPPDDPFEHRLELWPDLGTRNAIHTSNINAPHGPSGLLRH
jgi:hypothetical protein